MNTIEQAIEDIKNGKLIIVMDDEQRENEGDLIISSEKITYEQLNFIAKYARGLICVPISEELAKKFNLNYMVENNTDTNKTAFTESVDSINTTTGISIQDRLNTIKSLANPKVESSFFKRPGHIFPLIAKNGGVLARDGHTEAAVDLMELAGLKKSAVICEILKENGEMARLSDLKEFSKQHNLSIITIKDLIEYKKSILNKPKIKTIANLPTEFGNFKIATFENLSENKEHVAIFKGELNNDKENIIRIHSECFTGDIFRSKRCDCGAQLSKTMETIEEIGSGIILYLRQEGRGIGLTNKIDAYKLQDNGFDTVEANILLGFEADLRDYKVAAEMLNALKITNIKILTNNFKKANGLKKHNIEVKDILPIEIQCCDENIKYLKTKKEILNHNLNQWK